MKIAIASTGLGHVQRGIEAWARAMAENLHESGEDVVLFHGGGTYTCENRGLQYLKRGDRIVRWWTKLAPGFMWRWALNSPYGVEQVSFSRALINMIREEPVDIIHTQDVILAERLERARKKGIINAPTILAHGTDESPAYLSRFQYLQHLSPDHMRKMQDALSRTTRPRDHVTTDGVNSREPTSPRSVALCRSRKSQRGTKNGSPGRKMEETLHFCIPNFVDVQRFCPAQSLHVSPAFAAISTSSGLRRGRHFTLHPPSPVRQAQGYGEARDSRERFGIPDDAFVIGCSAALKKRHKRIDALIREFSTFLHQPSTINHQPSVPPYLLLAGFETDETPEIERLAREQLGDHCLILKNLPFEQMPDFYRSLDLYVHPALEEFFGICFLEAMACEVPCVGHRYPATEWIIGDGGSCIDMAREGMLAKEIEQYLDANVRKERGEHARKRVEGNFSWKNVYPKFMDMYQNVLRDVLT